MRHGHTKQGFTLITFTAFHTYVSVYCIDLLNVSYTEFMYTWWIIPRHSGRLVLFFRTFTCMTDRSPMITMSTVDQNVRTGAHSPWSLLMRLAMFTSRIKKKTHYFLIRHWWEFLISQYQRLVEQSIFNVHALGFFLWGPIQATSCLNRVNVGC